MKAGLKFRHEIERDAAVCHEGKAFGEGDRRMNGDGAPGGETKLFPVRAEKMQGKACLIRSENERTATEGPHIGVR